MAEIGCGVAEIQCKVAVRVRVGLTVELVVGVSVSVGLQCCGSVDKGDCWIENKSWRESGVDCGVNTSYSP